MNQWVPPESNSSSRYHISGSEPARSILVECAGTVAWAWAPAAATITAGMLHNRSLIYCRLPIPFSMWRACCYAYTSQYKRAFHGWDWAWKGTNGTAVPSCPVPCIVLHTYLHCHHSPSHTLAFTANASYFVLKKSSKSGNCFSSQKHAASCYSRILDRYTQMGREVLEGLHVSQSQQRPLSRKSTNGSLPSPLNTRRITAL